MKNIQKSIFSIFLFFLLSCGSSENQVDRMETSDSVITMDSAATGSRDFNNSNTPNSATTKSGKINSPQEAWLKLLHDYKGKPAGSGDMAFKGFLEMQEIELKAVNERHKSSPINESLANAIFRKMKLSPRQKSFVDSVEANGFAVEIGEGMSYVVWDWLFFSRYNISFLSPGVRSFIKQMGKDQKEGFAKDASLTITPVQLADRVVWWKKFRDENPSFILQEMEREHTHKFLLALVNGTDNTPLLTGENELFEFYVEVKEHLSKNYPRSPVTRLLVPYYSELETNPASAKRKIKENIKTF